MEEIDEGISLDRERNTVCESHFPSGGGAVLLPEAEQKEDSSACGALKCVP